MVCRENSKSSLDQYKAKLGVKLNSRKVIKK